MTLTTNSKKENKLLPSEKLNRDQFINIWGFMLSDFKLEKTELLVYAVIFSIYKHKNDSFAGTREYLRAWTNTGKTAINDALNSLLKKNLIIKEYSKFAGVSRPIYCINTEMLPTCEMFELENRNRDNNEKIRRAEKLKQYGIY